MKNISLLMLLLTLMACATNHHIIDEEVTRQESAFPNIEDKEFIQHERFAAERACLKYMIQNKNCQKNKNCVADGIDSAGNKMTFEVGKEVKNGSEVIHCFVMRSDTLERIFDYSQAK